MQDENKTRDQVINELAIMRQRVAELERLNQDCAIASGQASCSALWTSSGNLALAEKKAKATGSTLRCRAASNCGIPDRRFCVRENIFARFLFVTA